MSSRAGGDPLGARPDLDERRAYVPRARQERFIVPLLNRAILESLNSFAARASNGLSARALDVGCGGQPFRASIESRGWSYFGLDTQTQPGVQTEFICAIDQPLPEALARAAGFGLILCTETLEHVADWHAAFANLSALLAPGGVLLITCPHVYPLHEQPYDFWRPTPYALRWFASKYGLEVVDERRLGTAWDVLGTVLGASAPSPATRGPISVIASAIARPLRSLAIACISLGILQRLIRPKGDVYLSNLVVLQRPREHPRSGAPS